MPTPNPCAPRAETTPLNSCGHSNISLRGERDFLDAARWGELAAKHLARFNLPAWSVPCSPEEMRRWLDRLDMTERDHFRMTATNLSDFIKLNPSWPLRAWIGLACELAAEVRR